MRRCCSDNVAALGSLGRRQVRLCIALMAINHFTVIGTRSSAPSEVSVNGASPLVRP